MKHVALAAVLLVAAASAAADTVGSYLVGGPDKRMTLTISYKDDQHIRLDVGPEAYMLVNGGKAWMVTRHGGQPVVMDLDSLAGFGLPGSASGKGVDDIQITKTGATETVAGIKGEVYRITQGDEQHEAVLSTDKRAQALNKAFIAVAKRLGQSLGADTAAQLDIATREAQAHGYGGLLRSDQAMVLQSLKEAALPASTYELPAGAAPVQLPRIDPAMMQQMQQMMEKQRQQMQGK